MTKDEIVVMLIQCRSSVKFDLYRYEKMAIAYGRLGPEGEANHSMAETEANRLLKLLEKIDAIERMEAAPAVPDECRHHWVVDSDHPTHECCQKCQAIRKDKVMLAAAPKHAEKE